MYLRKDCFTHLRYIYAVNNNSVVSDFAPNLLSPRCRCRPKPIPTLSTTVVLPITPQSISKPRRLKKRGSRRRARRTPTAAIQPAVVCIQLRVAFVENIGRPWTTPWTCRHEGVATIYSRPATNCTTIDCMLHPFRNDVKVNLAKSAFCDSYHTVHGHSLLHFC